MLPPADLVIDAAYGTGFHGTWNPPDVGDTPVLAVDMPSGVNALTGSASGPVLAATRTRHVPGAEAGPADAARQRAGGRPRTGRHRARRPGGGARACPPGAAEPTWPSGCRTAPATAHKWRAAVRIVAGSVGMTGAAALAAHAAMRAGAGMVQLSAVGCLVMECAVGGGAATVAGVGVGAGGARLARSVPLAGHRSRHRSR